MSISQYLQYAKTLVVELGVFGRIVSQAKFNVIVYCNIRTNFHPIVMTLNNRPESSHFQNSIGIC